VGGGGADVEPARHKLLQNNVVLRLLPPIRSYLCNVRVCIPVVIRSLTFFRGAVVEEKNTRSSSEINTPTAMFIVVD